MLDHKKKSRASVEKCEPDQKRQPAKPSRQLNWGTNSGNTNQITALKIKPAQQDAIITIEDFFMMAKR